MVGSWQRLLAAKQNPAGAAVLHKREWVPAEDLDTFLGIGNESGSQLGTDIFRTSQGHTHHDCMPYVLVNTKNPRPLATWKENLRQLMVLMCELHMFQGARIQFTVAYLPDASLYAIEALE